MSMIVVRRHPTLSIRLQALAEKLYSDGMEPAEIALTLNDTVKPTMVVSSVEVERWIKDLHWIRRPEPKRGERITPPLPEKTDSGPWEPMFQSWMD